MSGRCKRISVRTMHVANQKRDKSVVDSKFARKSNVPDVHTKILCDAARLRKLARGNPHYCPRDADAPHILTLIRAAVEYANSLSPTSKENNFIYHGKRYPLIFTSLGRVKVCDAQGNILGASAYGAVE